MAVEVLLHLSHLLAGSLFGISLHAGVDGGVDGQSVSVEVVAVILAPVFHVLGHGFAEVGGLSVINVLYAVVQFDVCQLQRVELLLRQVAVLQHVVEHDVAPLQCVVGMDAGIVVGCGFQHAYKYGGLVGRQFLWRNTEISLAGSLDAECIRTKINSVCILGENLFLREKEFQLVGRNPLLALHDEHLDAGNVAKQSR